MILRRATVAYLLILSSLTLIPVSVYLTTPTAHAMIPFTSYQDIQAFIHTSGCGSPTPSFYNRGGLTTGPTTAGFSAQSNAASSQSPTHSETNQQVSGVDELDNVKNDGQYIYTITNNTVAIVQAYPTADSRLLSRVNVSGTLQGIFVVGNRLVIVSEIPGYSYPYYGGGAPLPVLGTSASQPGNVAKIYPIQFSGTTSLFVFDISNTASRLLRRDLAPRASRQRPSGKGHAHTSLSLGRCRPRLQLHHHRRVRYDTEQPQSFREDLFDRNDQHDI